MILPPDKIIHLCAGYIMRDLRIPFSVSVILAFGKEVYDYYDYGMFDPYDAGFTLIGIAIYECRRLNYGKNRWKKR